MTELTVIPDEAWVATASPLGRYSAEITKALIRTAPEGVRVGALVPRLRADAVQHLNATFHGLSKLRRAMLGPAELREAWLHSLSTLPVSGLVHSTSLLAPLSPRVDDTSGQTVVTVHGATPVSDRGTLKDRWFERAMQRAERYADAVIVPTYALAAQLAERFSLGDRVRVISAGAPTFDAADPASDRRAESLGLPERFIAVSTSASNRASGELLIDMLAHPAMPDVPVVVLGAVAWQQETLAGMAVAKGLPPARFVPLGTLPEPELMTVLSRALAVVNLDAMSAFGLPLLYAFAADAPVVHLSTPSLEEIAAGASVRVQPGPGGDLAGPFAEAVGDLVANDTERERLALLGRDRLPLFHWDGSAEDIWRLHAEL